MHSHQKTDDVDEEDFVYVNTRDDPNHDSFRPITDSWVKFGLTSFLDTDGEDAEAWYLVDGSDE